MLEIGKFLKMIYLMNPIINDYLVTWLSKSFMFCRAIRVVTLMSIKSQETPNGGNTHYTSDDVYPKLNSIGFEIMCISLSNKTLFMIMMMLVVKFKPNSRLKLNLSHREFNT